MKRLSREFSKKEKILLLVLIIVLIGLCYYQFVHKQVNRIIQENETTMMNLQTELDISRTQEQMLANMKENVELMKNSSIGSMPSYNNCDQEIALLNDVLRNAMDYNVQFADPVCAGNLIRRNYNLQCTVKDYDTACEIIRQLADSEYRCLIQDVAVTASDDDLEAGVVRVTASAVFYETLSGGTPDSALQYAAQDDTTE